MEKGYKESREMGRAKPKESLTTLTEEEVTAIVEDSPEESIEVNGDFFFKDGYIGDARKAVVIKSDLVSQKNDLENASGKSVVGLLIMEDGSIMMMLEE